MLQRHDPRAEFVALHRQRRRVDQHAVALDAIERLAAGHFQFIDESQAHFGFEQRPQRQMHVERLIRVFAGVFGGLGDVDLAK